MKVSLFITCYNDTLFPETGKAVVRVLERLGHQVIFPADQTCCGQMHWNTGYLREAIPIIRHFLKVFRDADIICIPSSSCVAMIRDHYPKAARESNDPAFIADVEAMLPRIYEFSELLVNKFNIEDVGATYPHRVTYHASCHSLRSLHLGDIPYRLLRNVRGLEFIPLTAVEECCGFGGTFAIKNAAVSTAMLADKSQCIVNTGAQVCTAVDNSCLMHLAGGFHRNQMTVRTVHIAEILASTSYGSHP
ncbi:MAG TPA: (Fe-S)-binding protein [Acidisarcina sp.]